MCARKQTHTPMFRSLQSIDYKCWCGATYSLSLTAFKSLRMYFLKICTYASRTHSYCQWLLMTTHKQDLMLQHLLTYFCLLLVSGKYVSNKVFLSALFQYAGCIRNGLAIMLLLKISDIIEIPSPAVSGSAFYT